MTIPIQLRIETVEELQRSQGNFLKIKKLGISALQRVIKGSRNWSKAVNFRHHEALEVMNSLTVTAYFKRDLGCIYTKVLLK